VRSLALYTDEVHRLSNPDKGWQLINLWSMAYSPWETCHMNDFDFLTGDWMISHRRLLTADTDEWDEFEGEATVWSALGGMASIEELRIPARNFAGMGVRVFHIESGMWADHWVSGSNGVVNEPMMGTFVDGVGTFTAVEDDDGVVMQARGVWDHITPTSCRWHQATSSDGGATWDTNWSMEWQRVN
jgi:hypothetical protein